MLGDMIREALPRFRAQAESMMLDTCAIRPVIGESTDDLTGVSTPIYGPAVYEGKCKIGGDRPYEQSPEAGGATFTVQRYILHVPWSAGPFEPGMVVDITASELQPHLVGNVYRIAGRDERSTQTAQRMFVEIVS